MRVKKLHGMGNHLVIDAYGCNEEKIKSIKLIETFLKDLVDKINLKIIKGPIVLHHEAEDKEESGVTGFAVLAESHVSIHTYPEKKFLSLDIFACSEFDLNNIKEYINKTFDVEETKEFLIKREYETC